ncbi:bacterial luciferase-like protein [Thozetella sp. PMI_491]|nr:bacterial luciferase-like protein [Thozetella sp. PMI_491]
MASTVTPKKMIQLNLIDNTSTGAHMAIGQWKAPRSMSRHKDRLDYYVWLAKTAEKGKMTSIFFADLYGTHEVYGGNADATYQGGFWVAMLDPVVVIGAMAQATTSLSFAVTGSTSYLNPYIVARTWASLDHITRGRIGLNVVTSFGKSSAQCMGIEDAVPHDERYKAAEEFMDILYRLWEQSWEDDSQVWSADPEMAYDPAKIHKIVYKGQYHSMTGYGATHPSPQRTPVLFQAGASSAGTNFAGKHAEGIYCGASTIAGVRKYTQSVRAAAQAAGRDPSSIKLFSSFVPVLGRTMEEAQAKYDKYKSRVSWVGGLASFSALTGIDVSRYGPDEPFNFDDEDLSKSAIQGIFNNFKAVQNDKPWTPRMVGERVALGGFGPSATGTPEHVADEMERWINDGGLDGFNIVAQCNPESVEDVVELLVPELQRRGIYWKDYPVPGGTFRENLQERPGKPFLAENHPGSQLKRNASMTPSNKTAVEV